MSSTTYSPLIRKVRNSAALSVINLHQLGYNHDFTITDRHLLCVQNNKLFSYEDVEMIYQSEYYDELTYTCKFIYAVSTQCGLKGLLITEKKQLENAQKFKNPQSISIELINRLDPFTYNLILGIITKRERGQDRLLVKFRNKILPISFSETAFFHLEHDLMHMITYDGRSFIIQKTMEELEQQTGLSFFRVNRQFLINKPAIKELTHGANRTILIALIFEFPARITVSRNRSGSFLEWFALDV